MKTCVSRLTTIEFKATSAPPLPSQTPDFGSMGNSCSERLISSLYEIEGERFHFLTWTEHSPLFKGKVTNPLLKADWERVVETTDVEERSYSLSRDVGSQLGGPAPWLYLVSTDIPEDIVAEYVAWYDEEHLPRLVNVPGIRRARRYVCETSSPKFLTAYSLDEKDAFTSPEGLSARKTPWTERMRGLFTNTRRFTCIFLGQFSPLTPNDSNNRD